MKCQGKNGGEQHEIMAKANGEMPKHCSDCGAPAAPDAPEMTKCTACDSDMMLKAKFCQDCGTEARTPVESLDAVAAEMAAFSKARVAAKDEPLPVLEDVEVDDDAIDAIMAKAQTTDDQGNIDIDAMPVVAEFLKAEQATQQFLGKNFTHIDARLGAILGAVALMCKAVPAMASMLKAVDERVTELHGKPGGRRTPAVVAGPSPTRSATAFDDLGGDDLMAKALVATEKDSAALTGHEVAALEGYCAAGYTLKSIIEEDTPLGMRTLRALQSVTH